MERGIELVMHLAVTYLYRSGTRLNVKTITNTQLVLYVILWLVKTVHHHVCKLLFVYTVNQVPERLFIRHSKMYANSVPPSLVLHIYILGINYTFFLDIFRGFSCLCPTLYSRLTDNV